MAEADKVQRGEVTEEEICGLLKDPRTYPSAPSRVEVIETHAARIFLAGTEAYKVKKHVAFPFLDFTSLEARRRAIRREMELNERAAPAIYRGVVAVTRAPDGSLALGGTGTPVEWVLHMGRFEQDDLLARVAGRGPLGAPLSKALANMVAGYHRACEVRAGGNGQDRMRRLVESLSDEIATAAGSVAVRDLGTAFRAMAGAQIERVAAVLDARAAAGAVRRCHGDLHLANIVLQDDHPVPFDALEFDEELATIDVLYDLAFLLMDLDTRGDRAAANVVLTAYTGLAPVGGEYQGLACLPLFLACRAAVRAVVAMERARQSGAGATGDRAAGAQLMGAAIGYLADRPARLIAVGGLSGTGKSTLAAALAPHLGRAPGAIHLRSDVERKRLFGLNEQDRLGPDGYTPDVTRRVYDVLSGKAELVLRSGHGVIVDAVFAAPDERKAIETIAARAGCSFDGLWLEASAQTLVARVEQRRGDASDADARVVAAQLQYDTGAIDWRRIDAGDDPAAVLDRAARALNLPGVATEKTRS